MTSLKQVAAKKTARPTKQKKSRVTRRVHWPGLQAPSIATLTGEEQSLACCRDTQRSGCTLAGAETTAAEVAGNLDVTKLDLLTNSCPAHTDN